MCTVLIKCESVSPWSCNVDAWIGRFQHISHKLHSEHSKFLSAGLFVFRATLTWKWCILKKRFGHFNWTATRPTDWWDRFYDIFTLQPFQRILMCVFFLFTLFFFLNRLLQSWLTSSVSQVSLKCRVTVFLPFLTQLFVIYVVTWKPHHHLWAHFAVRHWLRKKMNYNHKANTPTVKEK